MNLRAIAAALGGVVSGDQEMHMTALILPFPIVRRHGFIRRQAERAASMNYDSCVRYVERQLTIQRDAMRRRGIAENLIDRELYRMAMAMRREFLLATAETEGGA
jgi:Family of unknown function (DUF6074)